MRYVENELAYHACGQRGLVVVELCLVGVFQMHMLQSEAFST